MKIYVTGAAGFVGSALAELLLNRNHDVTLIDNYYIPSHLKDIGNIPIQNIDIRDEIDLSKYDVLVHLAAISGIRKCEEDKEEAFDVNVRGTFNLLKTFKGRVIFASTSAIYGQTETPEITEEHPIQPKSCYGETKAKAEDVVKLHTDWCILRCSNIYGKALKCKRTVADLFIENAIKNEPLLIHGDGKQRRDFVHIHDVVKAYWYAINSPVNDIFNIGGNEALSINDIAEVVCKNNRQLLGITPEVKHIPIDAGILWKDFIYSSKKAKDILLYEPSYKMADEVRMRLNAYAKRRK